MFYLLNTYYISIALFMHTSIGIMVTDRDAYIRRRLGERFFVGKRKFAPGSYSFEHSFMNGRDGIIRGFTLQVRPESYGSRINRLGTDPAQLAA